VLAMPALVLGGHDGALSRRARLRGAPGTPNCNGDTLTGVLCPNRGIPPRRLWKPAPAGAGEEMAACAPRPGNPHPDLSCTRDRCGRCSDSGRGAGRSVFPRAGPPELAARCPPAGPGTAPAAVRRVLLATGRPLSRPAARVRRQDWPLPATQHAL